jgi:hypothetical protein
MWMLCVRDRRVWEAGPTCCQRGRGHLGNCFDVSGKRANRGSRSYVDVNSDEGENDGVGDVDYGDGRGGEEDDDPWRDAANSGRRIRSRTVYRTTRPRSSADTIESSSHPPRAQPAGRQAILGQNGGVNGSNLGVKAQDHPRLAPAYVGPELERSQGLSQTPGRGHHGLFRAIQRPRTRRACSRSASAPSRQPVACTGPDDRWPS